MKVKLTTEQFDTLRALLSRAAGLVFDDSRHQSMSYSVAERVRESGAADVTAYLAMLDDPAERQRLLDEVTIQETHFFRNPPQVRALRTHVLPELIAHASRNGRRLRIWSAGCSTGEEPYTVAMLLRELMPSTAGWDVKVIATDISSRALEAAQSGRYGARAVQLATPDELMRFFQPGQGGTHEVRPEIRDLVEFRHHNLVTEPVPFAADERVDLILCRNVTIYFGRQTTRSLMERLHESLRDGGYLFLGHSETLWQVSEQFHLVSLGMGDGAAFVYRRHDDAKERRAVLPDRRTRDEGPPARVERRVAARREEAARPPKPTVKPTVKPPAKPTAKAAPKAPTPAGVRAVIAEGDYETALELAGQLIVAAPLDAEAFYLRGLALTDLGRDEQALVDLRKAVYLEPSMGFAHFLLAGVLDRLGHPAAAAVEYGATADTLGTRPGDATAHELGGRSVRELVELCRQLEGGLANRAGKREEVR